MKQYKATKNRLGEPEKINSLNWEAFAYRPEVEFRIGYTLDRLLVSFEVVESHLRAHHLVDNEAVWQDSCVEIFIQDPDGRHYYNFEVNCVGVLLASRRTGRKDAVYFTEEQLARVVRSASLPLEHVDIANNSKKWSLSLEIPFDLIGYTTPPQKLKANLYKCGDETATPHYVSWSPIATESPDFHRPEFFGELVLENL